MIESNNIPEELQILPHLNEAQFKCLRAIYNYFKLNKYYPTNKEIASSVYGKGSGISNMLKALENKGYITREGKSMHRNIRLTSLALKKIGGTF